MAKLFFSVLGLLLITTQQVLAQVQLQRNIPCTDAASLLKELVEDYKEQPNWLGESVTGKSRFVLHINHENGEWTLLQIAGNAACVLATGVGSIVLPKFEEPKPKT